ncbi:MAG: hypothetical protein IT439_07095 [Phycisphaerales bacterium]|nr:hypothetical protein [Phycisphaerales bacterium]
MSEHTRMNGPALRFVTVSAVAFAALCWAAPASADQILQTSGDSLTTYKYAGNTRVQGVRPRAEQRGVGLDGAQRAGGSLPWALAGNPFESVQAGESLGSLRLAAGAYSSTEIDLTLPAQVPWVVGRTFNARQETITPSHLDSDGYQGRNWFQISQPEIRLYDADSNPATKQAADLVYLVYGADRYVEFKRTAEDADTFRGVNGAAGVFKYVAGSPDTYVYHDQNSSRTYFFGGNAVEEAEGDEFDASWQLWKFVDAAENTAYVGHATTASTAITTGYNADGTIARAFDSSERRYCYAYDSIDGATRLTQVIAEIEDGESGWGDCGTETLVGKVEYAYYQTGDTTHGGSGNLKLVTITTPLSDPVNVLTRRQYYRYYTGSYHATNNPGHANTIKMMLGYEGVRRADWDPDGSLDGSVFAEPDNAQGEQVWSKDQSGNIIQTDFDTAGRETHRRVTTLAGTFDGAVRRISTTYLTRGLVSKVTQYDNAAPGSGSLVDDVKYTYDDWGNLYQFKQDVDSDLDGSPSGRAAFEVSYAYAKATTGRNTIRRIGMTLPGATGVGFEYVSTGGRLDDASSRVTRVGVDTGIASKVPVAWYEYLGAARLVGTDLLQPKARWNHFEGASGGNPYPDLDRFNRVEDSRWTSYKGTGTRTFYDVDIAYDPASNILGVTDNVHKNVSGNRNFDALYTLDALNRLTRADEGTLTWSGGTGTISNRSRDERWLDASGNLALSQTGNWLRRRLDLNGDGTFGGTGELDDTSTFSLANELKTRDTDSNSSVNYTLAYDKNGNQTDDGKDYLYDYDAFGRLTQVRYRISPTKIVAQYRYNGLGFRIGWRYDSDASGGGVDGGDPWYFFCYDDAWRVVATFRANDKSPKEVFVHHNAGLSGYGGSSYIDSVILRDKDITSKWTEEAEDERGERRYYCQNWRADVSAILTDAGSMVEWVKYSSYGVPFALPAGDTDSDGDWDATDSAAITGAYEVRKDANLDGSINASDVTHANSITGGYQTLGRGRLSSSGVNNRRGYAGYEYDPTFEGAGRHLYHVRNRVYDADIGRWLRRDPLGYMDGMSLYQYVQSLAIIAADPWGLLSRSSPPTCAGGTCSTPSPHRPSTQSGPLICVAAACTAPAPDNEAAVNRCRGDDGWTPATPGPWDLECPPGWYFNRYVNKCVPMWPTITPAPPKDRKPTTPEEEICAWACDQGPGVWGAVTCLNGKVVVCNCTGRKFRSSAGRGYARHLSSCIDACEPGHIPNIDCSKRGGQGDWVEGERGRVCSECAVNTCVRDCMQTYDCNSEPENLRAICELIKQQSENNRKTWCDKCDKAKANE